MDGPGLPTGSLLQPLPVPRARHGPPHGPPHEPQLSGPHVDFMRSMRDSSARAETRSGILQMVARLCHALTLEQQCSSATLMQAYRLDKAESVHAFSQLSLLEKTQQYHERLSQVPYCFQVAFKVAEGVEGDVVYHDEGSLEKTVLAVHSNFAASMIQTTAALVQDEPLTWKWCRQQRVPPELHPLKQMLSFRDMHGQVENAKMVREVYTEAFRSVWLLSDTPDSMHDLLKGLYGVIYKNEALEEPERFATKTR